MNAFLWVDLVIHFTEVLDGEAIHFTEDMDGGIHIMAVMDGAVLITDGDMDTEHHLVAHLILTIKTKLIPFPKKESISKEIDSFLIYIKTIWIKSHCIFTFF